MIVSNTNDYTSYSTSNLITRHTNNTKSSVEKLASGVRINSAKDDPAGIVTAAQTKGRALGAEQAAQNAQNAAAVAGAADSMYTSALDILYRMREIATQGVDPTLTSAGKSGLTAEVSYLNARLTDMANSKFGSKKLFSSAFTFQFGVDNGQSFSVTFAKPTSVALTVGSSKTSVVDDKIKELSANQANVGGAANAFGMIADAVTAEASSMWNAYEGFTNTNIAAEMSKFVKNSVLTSSAQVILAQYNQTAQGVLSVLK